jgi:hypothetical protein
MKKFLTSFTALLATVVLFTACAKEPSSSVDQSKIYAEYELAYNKNTDKTIVSAVFKFSNATGTQLQLSGTSNVKFNNEVLNFDPIFSYYKKELNGKIENGNFIFTDINGLTFNNPIVIAKTIGSMSVDTINRANGAFNYNWSGSSVDNNEAVNLTFINNANPFLVKPFLQYTVGSSNLVLGLSDLNQMPIGMATANLIRTIETNAPAVTSAGGKIRSKYTAENKNIYIK